MVEDEYRTPDLPLGDGIRYGLGAQKQLSKDASIKFAYEIFWSGDLDMDANKGPLPGRLAGEYKNTAIHFFALGFNKKI